jgi:hypothetical protein
MLYSDNCPDWKIKIRVELRSEDAWLVVTGVERCPGEGRTKESKKVYLDWKKLDQKALGLITERISGELDESP